jgi:hypothetical protein
MSASYFDDEDGSIIDSALCQRCLNIPFDLFLGEQRVYKLYNTISELKRSAKHCAACKFWDSKLDYFKTRYLQFLPVILSSLEGPQLQVGLDIHETSISLSCQAESSGQQGRSRGDFDYFASSSLSRDSIDLMRALLDDCINSHDQPFCRGFQEFSDIPSRLLFVGDVTDPQLRVIRTSELSEVPVYVALSHCWGSLAENAPWKLNRTTVVGFQHEVPESSLPQTFVDAVKITRGLGESYIWIDSLCILQDCSVDWELESSKMAGIYSNALCTLGSASDGAHGGCVGVRSRCRHLRLQLAAGTIIFYRQKAYEYEDSPIGYRAWCLQERVLARRFIQFTDLGFMWFCSRQAVLEYNFLGSTSPEDSDLPLLERRKDNCSVEILLPPLLPMGCDLAPGSPSQASGRRNSLLQGWEIEKPSMLYSYWYDLVTEYTRRAITRRSDRLPAIAGLARLVAKRLPDDLYIMGLWLCDLANGLLWTVPLWLYDHDQEPSPDIAPSWSWLSQNRRVRYKKPPVDETELYGKSVAPTFFFLSAIDRDIAPFPLLRVLAPLVRVKCVQHHESSDHYLLHVCDKRLPLTDPGTELEEINHISLFVLWDQNAKSSYVDAALHCLILANCNRDETVPLGLVLKCLDPKINLYRRMGVFCVNEMDDDAIYWSTQAIWEHFLGLEREEFYIK